MRPANATFQTIVEPGEREELRGMMVSEASFETLGARPVFGRTFTSAEYAASSNFDFTPGRMLIKTDRDPQSFVPAIKAIVRRVNREQPFPDVVPLQAEIDRATAPRRFILRLIGLFSILGLALAVIGIYGVLAESVAERVPEIGVRIAPGAQPSNVGALILRHGIWMIAIGLGLGFAGALIVTRQMGATVFGVSTLDPLSYVVALDPVVALRSE